MEGDAEDREALAETTVFLSYFKDMPVHRQAGKVTYPLDEILLLCLLAVLPGAEAFGDIARFGEKKLDLLRRFRPRPSHEFLPIPSGGIRSSNRLALSRRHARA